MVLLAGGRTDLWALGGTDFIVAGGRTDLLAGGRTDRADVPRPGVFTLALVFALPMRRVRRDFRQAPVLPGDEPILTSARAPKQLRGAVPR